MTELETKLNQILTEKTTKIIPENIKKDVEIFDILGTYEGSGSMNIFVQTTEPLTYNGIWIKSNSFTYDNIVEINNLGDRQASSINIVKGIDYETLITNNFKILFSKIRLTDSNNEKLENIEVYYGDGEQWVDISPETYTELTYIKGTTQYIDTGVLPTNSTKVEIKFEVDSFDNSGYCFLYGGEPSYNSSAFHLYRSGSTFDVGFGGYSTVGTFSTNTLYDCSVASGTTTINSQSYSTSSNTITNTSYNIYLFALKRSSVWTDSSGKKIYYCKIYENNNLVRYLIPVKKLDNTICFYDKIYEDFYYNLGTGTFTAGEPV